MLSKIVKPVEVKPEIASKKEFKKIMNGFGLKDLSIKKFAGCGDKLLIPPSFKYKNNLFFKFIKIVFPRFVVTKFENILGMALTVNAYKQKIYN